MMVVQLFLTLNTHHLFAPLLLVPFFAHTLFLYGPNLRKFLVKCKFLFSHHLDHYLIANLVDLCQKIGAKNTHLLVHGHSDLLADGKHYLFYVALFKLVKANYH